jgi:hypothetical protein
LTRKTKAALWVALAMTLLGAPMLVLNFVRLTPLWLHITVLVVLSFPGMFAMMAAWKNYHEQHQKPPQS